MYKNWLPAALGSLFVLAACGGSSGGVAVAPAPAGLSCDDSIKTGFKPDANTSVLLVKVFKQGEPLLLQGSATPTTPTADADLCLVKLNIGPGNPGPVGALSTSPGIGIEVWLPTRANWNQRLRVLGGGGWGGGYQGSITEIQNQLNPGGASASVAATQGFVSASSDTGHADMLQGGSFTMNPDGTPAAPQWRDFVQRSVHEMAVKTKALATAYYGTAPKYAYFDGGSMGGRQGLQLAQVNPEDYDGLLVAFPAINWSRLAVADMYPQIVIQRDLGGVPLTGDQLSLVSKAAIGACDMVGGQHLGFILDQSQCRYDPTKDADVLCLNFAGNGGVTGANTTPHCVNLTQATAFNKIWYGMTSDGSVPDPAIDNGWDTGLTGNRRWYGPARGTELNIIASPAAPFSIASDMVGLVLQDPTYADPGFVNATGNGLSGWKGMSYAQLSYAFDRGIALQGAFAQLDTNNPDLSAYKARGGKIIQVHGEADGAVFPQISTSYYDNVSTRMGGLSSVQSFYRLYMVPAMGHGFMCPGVGFFCNDFTTRYPNGTMNPDANPPVPNRNDFFASLQKWVEEGVEPGEFQATSMSALPAAKSAPVCAHPKKVTFVSGDPLLAASYRCQ